MIGLFRQGELNRGNAGRVQSPIVHTNPTAMIGGPLARLDVCQRRVRDAGRQGQSPVCEKRDTSHFPLRLLMEHNWRMSTQSYVLPVGDPRRPGIRRAVFGTVWAAAIFFVFTATKGIKPIYIHAPWRNDPFATVSSFTMFFVPLVTAFLLVQVSLCFRSEALPTVRVVNILRACRVAVGAILVDLASAWIAIVLRANGTQWTVSATGVEVGLLVLATGLTLTATVHLVRVPGLPTPDQLRDPHAPDWIGDAVAVAKRESHWFGPLRRLILDIANSAERVLVRQVRRHPLIAAATASAVFGATVLGWQGYREGYPLPLMVLAMGLGFCGMFAFLVPAGSYLGLVRSENPSSGMRRRVLDASVIASSAAIVTVAFRGYLWGLIGTTGNAAGTSQLATLEAAAILLAFTVALIVESILRYHNRLAQ